MRNGFLGAIYKIWPIGNGNSNSNRDRDYFIMHAAWANILGNYLNAKLSLSRSLALCLSLLF